MADIIVSVEDIRQVGNSLKKKGNDILAAYEQQCSSALNQSSECLKISGLNPEEFFKKLNEIYKNVNERLISLSDFLINDVAANYDYVSKVIGDKFNSELGSEIAGILGLGLSSGGQGGTNTPSTPTGGSGGSGGGDSQPPTQPNPAPKEDWTVGGKKWREAYENANPGQRAEMDKQLLQYQSEQRGREHDNYIEEKSKEWLDAYENANPGQRAEMDKQREQYKREQESTVTSHVTPPVYKPSTEPVSTAPSSSAAGQGRAPDTTPSYPSSSAMGQNPNPKPQPPKQDWSIGGSDWNNVYKQAQTNNPGMAAAMAEQRRTQS